LYNFAPFDDNPPRRAIASGTGFATLSFLTVFLSTGLFARNRAAVERNRARKCRKVLRFKELRKGGGSKKSTRRNFRPTRGFVSNEVKRRASIQNARRLKKLIFKRRSTLRKTKMEENIRRRLSIGFFLGFLAVSLFG